MKDIVIGLLLLTSPSYASVARMMALGQSTQYGSLYLLDHQNMFANPAYLNQLGTFMHIELGDAGAVGQPENLTTNPVGHGGFIQKKGSSGMGLWLGHDVDVANMRSRASKLISSTDTNADNSLADERFLSPDNTAEVFFFGRSSMDWGGSFVVSQNSDTNNQRNERESLAGARFGLVGPRFDIGAALFFKNFASRNIAGAEQRFSSSPGGFVWGGYKSHSFKTFFKLESHKSSTSLQGTETSLTQSAISLGIAKIQEIDNGIFFWAVRYTIEDQKTTDVTVSSQTLPLTMGFEARARDWLTLRGSIGQNFLIDTQKTTATDSTSFSRDNTQVAAGVGIFVDNLSIDGVLAAEGIQSTGDLNFSSLAKNIAITYNF